MFKYTRAALTSIAKDFKKWSYIFNWILLFVSIGYYVFAICTNLGYLWINIVSLSLITLFTIFDSCTKHCDFNDKKRVIVLVYNWSRIILRAITLGLTIYSLYVSAETANPVSIILATLMIIFWILSVLIEISKDIIISKYHLIINAFEEDVGDIKRPFENIGNTFKKFVGKEITEPKETKGFWKRKLDKIIEEKYKAKNEKE
jgi:hypothetical protein